MFLSYKQPKWCRKNQGSCTLSKCKCKHFSRCIFKLFQHLTAVAYYILSIIQTVCTVYWLFHFRCNCPRNSLQLSEFLYLKSKLFSQIAIYYERAKSKHFSNLENTTFKSEWFKGFPAPERTLVLVIFPGINVKCLKSNVTIRCFFSVSSSL